MIMVVLRLLYLIFGQLISWLTLRARTPSPKDIELLALRTRSSCCAERTQARAWSALTECCSLH
jgi:hypothetical protein